MAQAVLDAVQLHLALLPEGDGEAVADDDYSHFFMPLDPYATYVMKHDCAGGAATEAPETRLRAQRTAVPVPRPTAAAPGARRA